MAYAPPNTLLDPTNVMGRRIAAWFIDVIVPTLIALAIGWSVFIGAATKVSGVPTDYCTFAQRPTNTACVQFGNDAYVGTSSDARHAFAVGGLIYLIGALNLFVIQGATGATIAKHMLGLRVVRADGTIAGFGWNALRTLLLVVDQFFCALPGIITASVTHPHRRVGDFAAGTFVVAKQSVGIPIPGAMGGSAYPPPWTPPAPAGWGGPPPGGPQTWGTPQPGWGTPPGATPPVATPPVATPPAATPPPSAAPPVWGTPAAQPSPADTPATWGTPAPSEPTATEPAVTEPAVTEPAVTEPAVTEAPAATSTGDAPGWASPVPAATEPMPTAAAPQAQTPAATSREPQWDAQRNAWVYWEVETQRWLQHDPASGQWGPLR